MRMHQSSRGTRGEVCTWEFLTIIRELSLTGWEDMYGVNRLFEREEENEGTAVCPAYRNLPGDNRVLAWMTCTDGDGD